MTLDEFIEKLAAMKDRGWTLRDRAIRSWSHCRCPLEMVADMPQGFFDKSAKVLGLSDADREAIIEAADATGSMDPHLRDRLLAAVGLEP